MRSPARWAGCPVVLGPMASSPTHCANCVRSVQTVATKSEVEARCARWPWALRSSASHRRPGGDPPAALPTVAVREAASLHATLHLPTPRRPVRCPAEDGGEANPGSKGGARSVKTGRGTWTDSLPRRPRPRADATQVNGRFAPTAAGRLLCVRSPSDVNGPRNAARASRRRHSHLPSDPASRRRGSARRLRPPASHPGPRTRPRRAVA